VVSAPRWRSTGRQDWYYTPAAAATFNG
jgi:hypothetical protein